MICDGRRFELQDQMRFAAASGDHNPLHVDVAAAATNTQGALVVHGIHVLLWALNCAAQDLGAGGVASLCATFIKPILVGDTVSAHLTDDRSMLRVFVADELVMVVRILLGSVRVLQMHRSDSPPPLAVARDLSMATLEGARGEVTLPNAVFELASEFENLSSVVGSSAIAGLAGLSTLVGMHCPGLHGVLSQIDVQFGTEKASSDLAYTVKRRIPLFNRIEIEAHGFGLQARVHAFVGASLPILSGATVQGLVEPHEFEGARPLVIGATSGLGATSAMLLAAGSARPLLTWRRKRSDLDEVAAAIAQLGGECDRIEFDVTEAATGVSRLVDLGWNGQQIYFFATPRIFRRHVRTYQPKDLSAFWAVYVEGFYEMIQDLVKSDPNKSLHIFYPSTVAIDEQPQDLLEYVMAKEAGERLCHALQSKHRLLTITISRLPRVLTRQTRTFLNMQTPSPQDVMLPIVRKVQSGQAPCHS